MVSYQGLEVSVMDVLIESTKNFEQDLAAFSDINRASIVNAINLCSEQILKDKLSVYSSLDRPHKFKLIDEYGSSLYSLEVNPNIRLILTIDEDPIFDQFIITLFRVVRHSEVSAAYKSVGESIYQGLIAKQEAAELNI